MKLPAHVKVARAEGISAFNSWKQSGFPSDDTHVTYPAKRREYRQKLRKFVNQSETDRIKDLCDAANSNENLLWKLIKGQRSSSQISAFLVGGKLITDKNSIRNMWADHCEFLGKPSSNANFDSNFLARAANTVQEFFVSFIDDPSGTLSLKYEEVEDVCTLSYLILCLFLILPLFKGKGAKANNKDNYRGMTLFPTLRKIYEMVLLSRLERFAKDKGLFSDMQFGFREGVGCTEASFTILEAINHMIERGSNVFTCFLDVCRAFDTGLMVSFLSCSSNLESEEECGLP